MLGGMFQARAISIDDNAAGDIEDADIMKGNKAY